MMTPSESSQKHPITIEITKAELKNIMEQFEPDLIRDNEETYRYKEAIQTLEKSDQIIFSLYAELESERKVAELLGVSRSPIHKIIAKIRKEIKEKTNGYY